MNMFRNILTVASIAFGICLWCLPVDDWRWVDALGGQVVMALDFLLKFQPFSTIIFVCIGLALFMTRKQY
ncbi:MAG TPA: hypothetical protein VL981_14155 [Candidatus Methylacidiphilales bacterium]|nr:hypothetical protein [Candidatus Methylacidiphilales bacterium]